MAKPSVGLICDQPENSGIGKYGIYLQKHLQDDFDIEIVYFDFAKRALEAHRGKEREILGKTYRFPLFDNKPWFWSRTRNLVPDYDLTHIISQNLSFLAPRGRRWLVTCHDIAPLFIPSSPWERWGRRRLYSGLKRAETILTDSESTRKDLVNAYRTPPEKMNVIPLGVDAAIFRPLDKSECRKRLGIPAEARVVLNVSIDKWRKNVAGLIQAFAMLRKEILEALILLGGNPSRKTLDLVSQLNLSEKFRVMNPSSEEELAIFYNSADVFAFPSFYEGFGLPVLEAMACGTPVVASNRTSVPEVVGDAGILVDPEDAAGLAREIQRVLTEPSFSANLSRKGIERSSHFTWEKTASATAGIYKDILGARR